MLYPAELRGRNELKDTLEFQVRLGALIALDLSTRPKISGVGARDKVSAQNWLPGPKSRISRHLPL